MNDFRTILRRGHLFAGSAALIASMGSTVAEIYAGTFDFLGINSLPFYGAVLGFSLSAIAHGIENLAAADRRGANITNNQDLELGSVHNNQTPTAAQAQRLEELEAYQAYVSTIAASHNYTSANHYIRQYRENIRNNTRNHVRPPSPTHSENSNASTLYNR